MCDTKDSVRGRFVIAALLALLSGLSTLAVAQIDSFQSNPAVGPNNIFVHSKFGGQIFGFDIDQNGTEGILAESKLESNGNLIAAVETFDQNTGKTLSVVTETQDQDDFITLGVVGTSVGLFEHEHEVSFLHVQRTFSTVNPLTANKITGKWTPPIGTQHLLSEVSRTQGATNNAIFAYDNSGNFIPWVFSSNVGANTFGPIIKITDSLNFGSVPPPMAYNTQTNQAILGGGDGCFGCLPVIGVADLGKGTFSEFTGIGFGFVNGIAVDSADNIACTTTEDDASVEFYDLATDSGFTVVLPNSGEQQIFSGADVEFDSIHKLFLVAQPTSSSSPKGSTIYVYDTAGNLQETLNGFSFSNSFNVVAAHIAINPSKRTGFIDGPSAGVNEIQGFTY
ncbi:MAG TPA: hypothetical protein VMB66_08940 [Candidatus Acidoferrales bacterium]|nr:hypothetical protein [Candidatus Acidoferrales bacterium]